MEANMAWEYFEQLKQKVVFKNTEREFFSREIKQKILKNSANIQLFIVSFKMALS